jgi:anti-sigma factor RsiW
MKKREPRKLKAPRLCSQECEEFIGLITEYWEDTGNARLRTEIEQHTRVCPECAGILRSYSVTIRTCRGTPRVEEPREVHQRFWEQLQQDIQALKEYLD